MVSIGDAGASVIVIVECYCGSIGDAGASVIVVVG